MSGDGPAEGRQGHHGPQGHHLRGQAERAGDAQPAGEENGDRHGANLQDRDRSGHSEQ